MNFPNVVSYETHLVFWVILFFSFCKRGCTFSLVFLVFPLLCSFGPFNIYSVNNIRETETRLVSRVLMYIVTFWQLEFGYKS